MPLLTRLMTGICLSDGRLLVHAMRIYHNLNHSVAAAHFFHLFYKENITKILTVSLKLEIFVWYSGIGLLTPVYWPATYSIHHVHKISTTCTYTQCSFITMINTIYIQSVFHKFAYMLYWKEVWRANVVVVVVVCIRSHNWSARQWHHRLQSVV